MSRDITPVVLKEDCVLLLDQRFLPHEEVWRGYKKVEEIAEAIRDMVVRGAPAIGITAAMGVAIAALNAPSEPVMFLSHVESACDLLLKTRPTAVNLSWAVERMRARARALIGQPIEEIRESLRSEALAIAAEDIEMCRLIGRHGATLVPDGATVMTYCNAGALATGGYGTALGVIRATREAGKKVRVIACETRPYLQGARLTSWELIHDGFDVTLITDNAAGYLIAQGQVSCVIVGADRIAANGDTANKIGTYTLAVLAARHGIPFYVAAPSSTFDPAIPDGTKIPIEERGADEVLSIGGMRIAADGVFVRNPAFDVTPWQLVTAIITEHGILHAGSSGYELATKVPYRTYP